MDETLKVFVKNIPYDYSLNELKESLKEISGIVNINLPIVKREMQQLTKGYCIITFDKKENMNKFMKQVINCSDRILRIEKYNEKIKPEKPLIINVINVNYIEELRELFSKYEIKKCFIHKISGKSIGKGIVEFCNKKDYDHFLSIGKIIKDTNKVIFFEKFSM